MKKIIGIVLLTGIISLGGIAAYMVHSQRSGVEYYVQLTQEGMKKGKQYDAETVTYDYHETGVNEEGEVKELEFSSFIARPLRKDSYLVLVYNENNGVVSYREVEKREIPEKAMEKLESIHSSR